VFSLADTAQESTAMPEALAVYHPRDPTQSPLWNILHNNYEEFKANYDESYEKQYGFFRPVIDDVVHDYLKCGDLKEGFARVRCTNDVLYNSLIEALVSCQHSSVG
jgi:hypothetical protein